jgi:ribosomal protein L14
MQDCQTHICVMYMYSAIIVRISKYQDRSKGETICFKNLAVILVKFPLSIVFESG